MTLSVLRKSAKQYQEREQECERFTIVCAWCDRVQRGRDWRAEHGRFNGPGVSHGICPECYQRQLERLAAKR